MSAIRLSQKLVLEQPRTLHFVACYKYGPQAASQLELVGHAFGIIMPVSIAVAAVTVLM